MDEQLYLLGIGIPLADKVEKAIANLQYYEKEALRLDPINGYRLGNSYGKDSCVTRFLLQMSGTKFRSRHSFTTLDPPELLAFGRSNHDETTEERSPCGKALLTMQAHEKTTLATRSRRWCCSLYKERKNGVVNVLGVRAYESRRRRSWALWTPHITTSDWTLNPILYWTDDDVWQFIRENKIPYCSLYDEGQKRIGCIGCPMSSHRDYEFRRWPKYADAWKRAVTTFWKRLHDARKEDGEYYYWHKFGTPDHLWKWWMEQVGSPDDDECQMGMVYDN